MDPEAGTDSGGRASSRLPYLLTLAVLLAFAAAALLDSARAARDWPYGAPVRSDGTYASVMEPLIPAGAAIRPVLALREEPGVAALDRLVLPEELDALRDPIEYGSRMVSPVGLLLLEDLLGGKVVQEPYDPVLDDKAYAAALASGRVVQHGHDTYVEAGDGATAFRLFTDPTRTMWVVLADGDSR